MGYQFVLVARSDIFKLMKSRTITGLTTTISTLQRCKPVF